MARTKVSAHAVVTVTLEVDVDSSWGGDCAMDQVFKQAEDEALNSIRFLIQEANKQTPRCGRGIRVQGVPKITGIINKREEP